MITMGVAFVIFTMILLIGGVACTVIWFRQAGARLEAARAKLAAPDEGQQRL